MRHAIFILLLSIAGPALCQDRPGLFAREDFKETPAELPITQAHVSNPDLVLSLHGPGAAGLKKSNHDQPADDPFYLWSGEATGNWAVSLRHRSEQVDLSGQAKIRWRTRQSGFRELRIILRLASGDWIVSDQCDPASVDWRVREFNIADIRWRELNVETAVEGNWVEEPALDRVEEIGWTDLMRGGMSQSCSRLDWIEVYGHPVKRQSN